MMNNTLFRILSQTAILVTMTAFYGCGGRDGSLIKALELVEQGNYEQALPVLESVSSRHSDNPSYWCNIGLCYWQTGDIEKAIEALRKGVDLASGSPQAYEYLGRAYIDAGMWTEAREVLLTANQIGPGSASTLTALGIAEMKSGRVKEAYVCFTEALVCETEYPPALYNLAVLYRDRIKNPQLAERFFRRFIAAAPSDARAAEARSFLNPEGARNDSPAKPFVEKAKRFIESEEYDSALVALKEALVKDPGDPEAVWHMASLSDHILGDAPGAAAYYDDFKSKFPNDKRSTQAERRSQDLKDSVAKSRRIAEQTAKVVPMLPDDTAQVAEAREAFSAAYGWQEKGDKLKAAAFYKRAVELDVTMAESFYNLGLIYFSDRNLADARDVFARSVALDPGCHDARYMLARTQLEMGDSIAAVDNLNAVVRDRPAFAGAHYLLGVIMAGEKQLDAAMIHFERFAQLTGQTVR